MATPTINPNGGSYTVLCLVTMQTATSGASIYYTTERLDPDSVLDALYRRDDLNEQRHRESQGVQERI